MKSAIWLLFKELSGKRAEKEALLSIEKELLKMCMDKEMVFSFPQTSTGNF